MDIQLLPANRIHEFTDVEKNVAPGLLEPRIVRAQQKYLLPVLGSALYELVADAYAVEQANAAAPMPDRLDALHTALEPMLAQWVYYQSLPFLNVRTTNRGLDKSEHAISSAEYAELKKSILLEAEDRTADLATWLLARATAYPEFTAPTAKRRRTGGIVL